MSFTFKKFQNQKMINTYIRCALLLFYYTAHDGNGDRYDYGDAKYV